MKQGVFTRPIQPGDNAALAIIIRNSLSEFNADKPGTVYYDESTDHLSDIFLREKSAYFVMEVDGIVAGGGGFFPTEGLDADTCELVKMYLSKDFRGKGYGQLLLDTCMKEAKAKGFSKMYIETMPELKRALSTYEKLGFRYIDHPMGNTGHFGCDLWMLKELGS